MDTLCIGSGLSPARRSEPDWQIKSEYRRRQLDLAQAELDNLPPAVGDAWRETSRRRRLELAELELRGEDIEGMRRNANLRRRLDLFELACR